ncbi:GNAT family N-acetyltransferase [Actinacidiphila sp. ITFR-21]|uniref:GNAT family N-acetyltransferase n=1 Tax=Actinacidiphila sp. ITFR-21 TaxID=3075199 RepID=UPI00288BF63C|nr:GNAT family N-acetyltransferase [Streptomyces sp. ITFR-21]WNI17323.1 GNAT family N-acetyltransferase [Streptomyces sp. ITFR-21]
MDTDAVRALFDAQMRRDAPPAEAGTRVERFGPVIRQTGAGAHDWTGVLWSELDEHTADAAIAAQTRWLAGPEGAGREFEWKLYAHDRPADLGRRLLAAGFVPEPAETLMVAEVAKLPQDTAPPEGVRLEPVTDAAGAALMAEVHAKAFGTDGTRPHASLLDQLAHSTGNVAMTLALAGGEPVCSARIEFHPGTDFASLWGGGTVPAWRGRGVYRSLVAHRARLAAARGFRYLQVDASDESRPILSRLGFEPLGVTTPYLKQG